MYSIRAFLFMEKLKKLLSYLWDIPIEKSSSAQNEYLEVVWTNGKKMLNTKNANYSFGSAYTVFKYAFKQIIKNLHPNPKVLVLGFGCGSVEHLLNSVYTLNAQITGIEYDEEIIRLYHKHFTQKNSSVSLIHADAYAYIGENTNQYDLIIIDLFDDLKTIPFIYDTSFTTGLKKAVAHGGLLIYNTIKEDKTPNPNTALMLELSKKFKDVSSHNLQEINQIIIAK